MVARIILPLCFLALLAGCRADIGRHAAQGGTAGTVTAAPQPKATLAERMRSRWAQTAAEPGRVPIGVDDKSTMDALRGADAKSRQTAIEASSIYQQAKADRLAEVCLPYSTMYGMAHCH